MMRYIVQRNFIECGKVQKPSGSYLDRYTIEIISDGYERLEKPFFDKLSGEAVELDTVTKRGFVSIAIDKLFYWWL
jgi:hypothetical protein